jgi:hypothetical protein
MKLGAALLVWIGALFVAAPVLADKVSCCEFSEGSFVSVSADVAHGFETNDSIHGLFTGNDAFFAFSSRREGVSGSDLKDLASYERFASHSKPGKGWFGGRGKDPNSQGDQPGPTSVPEPGALSLLLMGLTAAGIFARRR